MKVRHGFVSNSSSSSFILAVHSVNEPCPHCHRKDPDLQDIIELSGRSNDETRIVHGSKRRVLADLKERIHRTENELHDCTLRSPNASMYPGSQWSQVTTVAEHVERTIEPALKELNNLRARIESAEGCVFECKVSYHDDLVNDLIEEMEKRGTLSVIYKEKE